METAGAAVRAHRHAVTCHTAREYRAVSWVYLSALTVNTTLSVSVSLGGDVWSAPYRVRTLPASDADLRIVAGGDSGVQTTALQLHRHAAASEPHVAIHGGDIAYGNGIVNCVARWDLWLYQWEHHMVTPSGFSVPVVLAIGNHESGGYELDGTSRSYFSKFFVQESSVVDTHSRSTYHAHKLTATTTLLVLDSSIERSHESQVPWLAAQLAGAAGTNKWACYHVPLFPSTTSATASQSADGRHYWEPLFDAYGLQLGLEHHDHSYKRTKKILNGSAVADSVAAPVYIGDGCWGVDPLQPGTVNADLFVMTAGVAHVFAAQRNANNTAWLFRALLANGTVLDAFEIR